MDIQKVNELLENPEFISKFVAADSLEDIQKLFANEKVSLSDEEVKNIVKIISDVSQMSEEDLSSVVGGASGTEHMVNGAKHIVSGTLEGLGYAAGSIIVGTSDLVYGALKIPFSLLSSLKEGVWKAGKDVIDGINRKKYRYSWERPYPIITFDKK